MPVRLYLPEYALAKGIYGALVGMPLVCTYHARGHYGGSIWSGGYDAFVAALWLTADSHVDMARRLPEGAGATITYEVEVQWDARLGTHTAAATAMLLTQALYAREDWLDNKVPVEVDSTY